MRIVTVFLETEIEETKPGRKNASISKSCSILIKITPF